MKAFKKNIILSLFLIFLVGLLMTVCSPKPESIQLVVRTGLESKGLSLIAKSFTEKTGIDVKIMELGREGYLSAVPTQLLTGSAKFDIAFLPSTMIAELAASEAIAPLDNLLNTKDSDLLATYGYGDKTYAIPCDISSMFLYFRKDLIINPPQTWEEYLEIAKKYSIKTNPKSPTKYGCAIPGMSGEDLPKAWYCILWSYGGFILDNKNLSGIGNEASIKAGSIYEKLIDSKVMAEDITSWGYSPVYENLENGKLAMAAPFWNAAATVLLTSTSPFKDKIGYTLVPGTKQIDGSIKRNSFQHAWTLTINSKSKNISNAAKFIEYATGREGGIIYAKTASGNPARLSILSDSKLQQNRPDFKVLLESLQISKSEPAVPYYAQLHSIMNDALTQILTGSLSSAIALKEAGERINAINK